MRSIMKNKALKGLIIYTFIALIVLGCGKSVSTDDTSISALSTTEASEPSELSQSTEASESSETTESSSNKSDSTSTSELTSSSSASSSSATGTSTAASSSSSASSSLATASSSSAIENVDIESSFYAVEIPDDIFEQMVGKSYKEDCVVPRQDIRYVHVLHKNLEGETLEGELVCHKIIAEDLVEIFRELYDKGYPIDKIRLIDEYDADDEASMTDNNSSCFNYRTMTGSDKISKHGLGIAVDINTLYNPYVKGTGDNMIIEPEAGAEYANRDADYPYKIEEGDLCYELFIEHGFEWGGSWNSVKDYQHFELSDERAEELQELYQY